MFPFKIFALNISQRALNEKQEKLFVIKCTIGISCINSYDCIYYYDVT